MRPRRLVCVYAQWAWGGGGEEARKGKNRAEEHASERPRVRATDREGARRTKGLYTSRMRRTLSCTEVV